MDVDIAVEFEQRHEIIIEKGDSLVDALSHVLFRQLYFVYSIGSSAMKSLFLIVTALTLFGGLFGMSIRVCSNYALKICFRSWSREEEGNDAC
jgi:hypothetical protein